MFVAELWCISVQFELLLSAVPLSGTTMKPTLSSPVHHILFSGAHLLHVLFHSIHKSPLLASSILTSTVSKPHWSHNLVLFSFHYIIFPITSSMLEPSYLPIYLLTPSIPPACGLSIFKSHHLLCLCSLWAQLYTGASHTHTYYILLTALLTFIYFLSRKYFYLSAFSSNTDYMQTFVHLFPALTTDDSVSCKLILCSTSCLT